jgi:predicted  nucleic acid-binding Zn-ribbon protein
MHADLALLIRLQTLENRTEAARRTIAELPMQQEALDTRLATAQEALATARQRLQDCQAARRTLEKELATVQGRLTRFKDQLMEVKTNKEYVAMQKEIAVAQEEVRTHEDRILERMLEADELQAAVKQADAELASEQAFAATERLRLAEARVAREQEIEELAVERTSLTRELSSTAYALFEHVSRARKGVAVGEARGGLCTVCPVRLRPQVFNEIRRNDAIIQCENCSRILYFVQPPEGTSPDVPQEA